MRLWKLVGACTLLVVGGIALQVAVDHYIADAKLRVIANATVSVFSISAVSIGLRLWTREISAALAWRAGLLMGAIFVAAIATYYFAF